MIEALVIILMIYCLRCNFIANRVKRSPSKSWYDIYRSDSNELL